MEQMMELHRSTPRQGWITGEDGKVYSTARSEDIESAQAMAKDEPDKCGELYDAVYDNDFEKVQDILRLDDKSPETIRYRKWCVNEKSWHDWRPLHAAAEAGYENMAKFLIECGAEIDALTNVKNTALQLAASGGHDKIVKMLLENSANTMVSTESGLSGTSLHYAAAKGHLTCVRLLAEAKESTYLVNQLSADNCTALYYAVCTDKSEVNLEIAKILLENGANETINEIDFNGQTPLHIAALNGDLVLLKLLVEVGGANVNIQDMKSRTPAMIAKEMNQLYVMNYLN